MSTPGNPGNPADGSSGAQPPRVSRRDSDVGRAIDAPTSNVERAELPKDLPDLDKIHHVQQPGARSRAQYPADTPPAAPLRPAAPAAAPAPRPAAPAAPLASAARPAGPATPTGPAMPSGGAPSASRVGSAASSAPGAGAGAASTPAATSGTGPTGTGPTGAAGGGSDEPEPAPSNLHSVSTRPARATSVRTAQPPLRAAMQLRHIDPWTTFKLSLVVSVVLFFVWMIAVGALYIVLGGMGVWSKVNESVSTLVNEQEGATLVSAGDVFWWAGIVGIANVVLMTGILTVGSFIYNLCAELVGGIQVTLGDRD